MPDDDMPRVPPLLGRAGPAGEWVASRYADVQAILADDRFEVPAAQDASTVGTIAWLRARVSRFANGAEHGRRRIRVVAELQRLNPDDLGRAAHKRAREVLVAEGSGSSIDVMAGLARRVPAEVMAATLRIGCPQDAADAVITLAPAYFAGTGELPQCLADRATARLVDLLSPAETDAIVARITLMIQGCDATAGLIGSALHLLRCAGEPAAGWPTPGLLEEVLRHVPPVRVSKRVARTAAEVSGCRILPGDTVLCSVESANLDPVAYRGPDHPDGPGQVLPSLTFGYGLRPCPGQPQALALAAGVIDAVRETCTLAGSRRIEYEPSAALRIPKRLEVVLR